MRIPLMTGALVAMTLSAPAQERRLVSVDDLFTLRTVADPQISPDGAWVAYAVTALDAASDRANTDLYMVPLAGGEEIQLTFRSESESSPRWSPDGRYLGFLASRERDATQVWLLDRRGGEAFPLTDLEAGVESFEWSPDGSRLALIASDPKPAADDPASKDRPQPIVINRLQFKRDGQGYLGDVRRHLYVFDVASKESVQLTDGPYDDASPVWSPDGTHLAFVSNRTREPDGNANTDVFVVDAVAGGRLRSLTTSERADRSPTFSPDGTMIAYVEGGEPSDIWYGVSRLAVVPAAGGPVRRLTEHLDRNPGPPRFSADGRSLLFLLEDGGNRHLARVPLQGGAVERLVGGERDLGAFDVGADGALVTLDSQPDHPPTVARVEADGRLVPLSRVNDDLLASLRLGPVQRIVARSADGTPIDAFVTLPPDAEPGQRLPTILRIHGGPVSQYSTRFNFEWQLLAAHGYAVVAANPRGSSGYGRDFSHALWADWGNKDFQDVMAAVDRVIELGIADPGRLGVGGWSYGGILTNYVITQTDRFRAAISGASEVNYLSNYGTDHYQLQWELELGLPWERTDLWIRMSPFFKVAQVVTPTLVMGGADDMNVPLLNSEQLYQALRRLGVETELVIYPGQRHGISRPSFQKDRYERYLAWYDRLVARAPTGASAASAARSRPR